MKNKFFTIIGIIFLFVFFLSTISYGKTFDYETFTIDIPDNYDSTLEIAGYFSNDKSRINLSTYKHSNYYFDEKGLEDSAYIYEGYSSYENEKVEVLEKDIVNFTMNKYLGYRFLLKKIDLDTNTIEYEIEYVIYSDGMDYYISAHSENLEYLKDEVEKILNTFEFKNYIPLNDDFYIKKYSTADFEIEIPSYYEEKFEGFYQDYYGNNIQIVKTNLEIPINFSYTPKYLNEIEQGFLSRNK